MEVVGLSLVTVFHEPIKLEAPSLEDLGGEEGFGSSNNRREGGGGQEDKSCEGDSIGRDVEVGNQRSDGICNPKEGNYVGGESHCDCT